AARELATPTMLNHVLCAGALALIPAILFAHHPAEKEDAAQAVKPKDAVTSSPARDDSAAEKLGWRLGVQAWTFRDRTAYEAIETAKKLGLKYIELYPGQPLRPDNRDARVAVDMSDADREALKQKLKTTGVKAVSFGVVEFDKNEA